MKSDIPSLEGYAKLTDIPEVPSMENVAMKSDIPSLEGYAKLTDIPEIPEIPSLDNYYTKTDVDGMFAEITALIGEATTITNTILA